MVRGGGGGGFVLNEQRMILRETRAGGARAGGAQLQMCRSRCLNRLDQYRESACLPVPLILSSSHPKFLSSSPPLILTSTPSPLSPEPCTKNPLARAGAGTILL